MKSVIVLIAAILLSACAQPNSPPPSPDAPSSDAPATDMLMQTIREAHPVTLSKVAENVWVHTTNYRLPGRAPIASNGLVVREGDAVVLVDGAWGELATLSLLEAVEAEVGAPVTRMIVTHHHPDRSGGVDAAELMGIEILTHPDTPGLAFENGFPVPDTSVAGLAEPGSRTKVGPVELAFPGAGHAPDNLVAYVPSAKILYGGCTVRGAGVTTLGNTASADLDAWPESLRWMKATYPETALVVPGHGKGADLLLIDNTIALLDARDTDSENP